MEEGTAAVSVEKVQPVKKSTPSRPHARSSPSSYWKGWKCPEGDWSVSPAALEPTQEHVGMYNRYGYFPAVLEWRHARKFPVTLIDNSHFTNSFSPPRLVSSEWSALVP